MSIKKSISLVGNQNGMGMMGTAVVALGVIIGGSVFVMKSRDSANKGVNLEVKAIRAKTDAQKALSVAGFLISSNFILCRQESWQNDNVKGKCRWQGIQSENNYKPEDFGLSNLRYESDYLTFDLNKEIFNRTGKIKFKLVDVNSNEELKRIFEEVEGDNVILDKDHYVVAVDTGVDYEMGDGVSNSLNLVGAFKRPISLPEITILGSSCVSQCNSSISENPHVSCRGPQDIDVNTVSEITGYTRNQGPGTLYELTYEREVDFSTASLSTTTQIVNGRPNTSTSIYQLGEDLKPSPVRIPFEDFLLPNSTVEWTDEVPCAQFVENTQSPQDNGKVSQHTQEAGKVMYKLEADSPHANIEPFRLTSKIVEFEDGFKGKLKINYVPVQVIHTH